MGYSTTSIDLKKAKNIIKDKGMRPVCWANCGVGSDRHPEEKDWKRAYAANMTDHSPSKIILLFDNFGFIEYK